MRPRRQFPGAVPTAKDREKYSCEAKPHLAAIWAMERSLVRSSCWAASMRVAAMVFWTVVPSAFLKAGTFGDTLPVNGVFTQDQRDAMNHLREVMWLTKGMLKPGVSGKEIAMIVV